MKAVVMTAPGDRSVLELVEVPRPALAGPRDLLVRLHAAGVNPIDTKVRASALYYPERLPAILGCDGAGVVEEVGAEVTRFKPGDAVYFFNGGIGGAAGNYAEYAVLEEDFVAPAPRNVRMVEAAALPLVLITAWESLFFRGGLRPDESVLVQAGAGGVGHVAVQLALNAGARVAATASESKADLVRSLGAGHVIDYHQQDVRAEIMRWTRDAGVDLVLDTVGGKTFNQSLELLGLYGRISTLVQSPFDPDTLRKGRLMNASVNYVLILTPELLGDRAQRVRQRRILEAGTRLVEAGRLRVHVSQVLPLSEARTAHELIEGGHTTGKIALTTA